MISDLFNIAGFMIPNPKELAKYEGKKRLKIIILYCSFILKIISNFFYQNISYKRVPKILVNNKSVLPQQLSNDERLKHQFYIQKYQDEVNILFELNAKASYLKFVFSLKNLRKPYKPYQMY